MADSNKLTFEEIEINEDMHVIEDIKENVRDTVDVLNTYLEDIYTRLESLES